LEPTHRAPHFLAEELNLEIYPTGSTTFKRLNQARGAEPDSFYIQNAARIGVNAKLTQDPPPDLVVEIDITSSSLNRFQIYATLGVPELWRYDEESYKSTNCENSSISPTLCDFCLLALEIPRFLESQNLGYSDDSVFPSLGKTTFKLLKIGEIRE